MPASRAWSFAGRTVLVGACLDGIACAKRESRERTQRAHAQKHRQGIAAHLVTRYPHFFLFLDEIMYSPETLALLTQ